MKLTDKLINKHISVSLSALYQHTEKTEVIIDTIKKTLSEFRDLMSLPRDIHFRVAPIKAKRRLGEYDVTKKLVHVDCRLGLQLALETIAHELVHAEQYHTGRLKTKYTDKKGWLHYWDGEVGKKGTTYKTYRNQPWEIEAWERQSKLAALVQARLEMKNIKLGK